MSMEDLQQKARQWWRCLRRDRKRELMDEFRLPSAAAAATVAGAAASGEPPVGARVAGGGGSGGGSAAPAPVGVGRVKRSTRGRAPGPVHRACRLCCALSRPPDPPNPFRPPAVKQEDSDDDEEEAAGLYSLSSEEERQEEEDDDDFAPRTKRQKASKAAAVAAAAARSIKRGQPNAMSRVQRAASAKAKNAAAPPPQPTRALSKRNRAAPARFADLVDLEDGVEPELFAGHDNEGHPPPNARARAAAAAGPQGRLVSTPGFCVACFQKRKEKELAARRQFHQGTVSPASRAARPSSQLRLPG